MTGISSILYLEPEHRTFALRFAKELRKPDGCTLTGASGESVVITGEIAAHLAWMFEGLGNGQVAVFHGTDNPPSSAGGQSASKRNRGA